MRRTRTPASLAYVLIESETSPRYTVDIVRDDHQAAVDVNRYFCSGDTFSTRSRVSFQQDHEDELNIEEVHNPILPLSVVDSEEVQQPPQASWSDIKDYFWQQGNYRTLVATSLTWLSLDLAFYGLGMVCLLYRNHVYLLTPSTE